MREVPGSNPGSAQIFYTANLIHIVGEPGGMIVLLLFSETVNKISEDERNNRK